MVAVEAIDDEEIFKKRRGNLEVVRPSRVELVLDFSKTLDSMHSWSVYAQRWVFIRTGTGYE